MNKLKKRAWCKHVCELQRRSRGVQLRMSAYVQGPAGVSRDLFLWKTYEIFVRNLRFLKRRKYRLWSYASYGTVYCPHLIP